jgi:hypothetical protein
MTLQRCPSGNLSTVANWPDSGHLNWDLATRTPWVVIDNGLNVWFVAAVCHNSVERYSARARSPSRPPSRGSRSCSSALGREPCSGTPTTISSPPRNHGRSRLQPSMGGRTTQSATTPQRQTRSAPRLSFRASRSRERECSATYDRRDRYATRPTAFAF